MGFPGCLQWDPRGPQMGVIPSHSACRTSCSELRRRTRELEKHVQHLQRGSEACCTALAAAVAEIRALTGMWECRLLPAMVQREALSQTMTRPTAAMST